jgi:hypothetical protein
MSDDTTPQTRLARAGAISGGCWFLLALLFDKGVKDFNYPVIPTNNFIAVVGSLIAAIITGTCIALLFSRSLLKSSRLTFFLLPFATIPLSIAMFSVLIWIVWLFFGNTDGVPKLFYLGTILSFFLFYACISLLAVFVYGFAILNQWALRATLSPRHNKQLDPTSNHVI